jgi:L-ribulose-5-phosphate 3-epimerase
MKIIPRILVTVAISLLTCLQSAAAEESSFHIGLQTYTCRNMDFDQMVEFASKHGLKYLQTTDKHINPKGTLDEIRQKKAVLDKHGLVCYTFGVAGTSLDKEDNRKLFEFAKLMGIKLIVVEPPDFKIFDNLEQLVKEYDIKIAIHNHGIRSLYGNPLIVKNILKHRDPRIGVCLDVGWITSSEFNPAKVFSDPDYKGRVFDIHLKDKRVEKRKGGDSAVDTKIGEGDGNLKSLLSELAKAKWHGILAIETDSPEFAKEPDAFVHGAIEFVKQNQTP